MNFRSYTGKVFVVESSKAIIRDEQFREQRYQAGETLPPGKNVGDVKVIPQRTEVKVTAVKPDSDRHTFVFAVASDSGQPFGWTSAMNLVGGFKTEAPQKHVQRCSSRRHEVPVGCPSQRIDAGGHARLEWMSTDFIDWQDPDHLVVSG